MNKQTTLRADCGRRGHGTSGAQWSRLMCESFRKTGNPSLIRQGDALMDDAKRRVLREQGGALPLPPGLPANIDLDTVVMRRP